MDAALQYPLPQFQHLATLSNREGIIALAMQEGIPVLHASETVQDRITQLLHKQQETELSASEREEFDSYEEIDDYLSLLNRITRNLFVGELPYDISAQNTGSLTTARS